MVTDSVEWNASIQYAIPALTLANFQLDAQNSLFIYIHLLKLNVLYINK